MLAYLLIPVALAIVFFAMSFLQKDKIEKVAEVIKQKTKKVAKKVALPKKLASKKDEVEDKPLAQKNFVEEQDIKEYASIQGRITQKSALVKKAEKKDEKKVEKVEKKDEKKVEKKDKKDEKKSEGIISPASPDDKKKKKTKASEWVTREQKPQRPVKAEKEEEKTEEERAEKKGDKKDRKDFKKGDKKDFKKGDRKGGDRKKDDSKMEENTSIYKVFKAHGADADKEEVNTDAPVVTTEETVEAKEVEEKQEKKERKERVERPWRKGPKMVAGSDAYATPEDFWETDLKGTWEETPEIVPVKASVSTAETSQKPTEQRRAVGRGARINAAPVQPSPYTGKTWESNLSPVQSEETQDFPALGVNAPKVKKQNKPKKDKQVEPIVEEKKNEHKREADTLFEYEVEAPSDKKIKLGSEAQKQDEHQDEAFVLPTTTL